MFKQTPSQEEMKSMAYYSARYPGAGLNDSNGIDFMPTTRKRKRTKRADSQKIQYGIGVGESGPTYHDA